MPSLFDVLGQDHKEVKRMLAELEKGPIAATGASDSHLVLRKKMVEELVIEESRHEAVEEMYFWSAVRDRLPNGDELADTARMLTDDETARLGDQIAEAKKTAPTHPHPHTPPSPAVLKGAGPAVGAADRLRDAATRP